MLDLPQLKERWRVQAQALGMVPVVPKTAQSKNQNQEEYAASNTQSEQKGDFKLQAHIEALLQLNDQDLLLIDRFIRNYFQSEESKLDTQATVNEKALLEALRSPQVQERVVRVTIELNQIHEQERRVQNLQSRKGLGF